MKLLGTILVLLLMAALVWAMRAAETGPPAADLFAPPAAEPTTPGTGEAVVPTTSRVAPLPEALPEARNVTPEQILPGPVLEGTIVRLPPRPGPAQTPRPREMSLGVTLAETPTRLKGRNGTVRLAHIRGPDEAARCRRPDLPDVACTVLARTALRAFIRRRVVVCTLPPEIAWADDLALACHIGKADIGLWMVARGWARPTDDAPAAYKDAQDRARNARLGIWGNQGTPYSSW